MSTPEGLAAQMSEVREDLREVRGSMNKIADAVTRMAVLEERHLNVTERLNRTEERVQNVEKKSSENEKAHLSLMATIKGIIITTKLLWGVVGVIGGGILVRVLSSYFGG